SRFDKLINWQIEKGYEKLRLLHGLGYSFSLHNGILAKMTAVVHQHFFRTDAQGHARFIHLYINTRHCRTANTSKLPGLPLLKKRALSVCVSLDIIAFA